MKRFDAGIAHGQLCPGVVRGEDDVQELVEGFRGVHGQRESVIGSSAKKTSSPDFELPQVAALFIGGYSVMPCALRSVHRTLPRAET